MDGVKCCGNCKWYELDRPGYVCYLPGGKPNGDEPMSSESCGKWKVREARKTTNADLIRQMDDWGLAVFLEHKWECELCPAWKDCGSGKTCRGVLRKWLEKEAGDD